MAIAHHNMWRFRFNSQFHILEESIPALLDIDSKVYGDEDIVDIQDILPVFRKFPRMYSGVLLGDTLIGYIAVYPISEIVAEEILKYGMDYDTDILDEDIDVNSNSLYLSSVAIVPEHQDSTAIQVLLSTFITNLIDISDNGRKYTRIIANVVSDGGNKFLSSIGFTQQLVTSVRNTLIMSVSVKDVINIANREGRR